MKIFPKRCAKLLYRNLNKPEFFDVLEAWARQVSYEGSPFLRQIASYYLGSLGYAYAPRIIKQTIGDYILYTVGINDFIQTILLISLECISRYEPGKGGCDLINYLAWEVPFRLSRELKWVIKPSVTYLDSMVDNSNIEELDMLVQSDFSKRSFDILCAEAGLSKQLKLYYKNRKVK